MHPPIVVSYGVGRDSTALLIEMQRRGIRPDAILFADTGSEKEQTYFYLPVIRRWLAEHDFPPLTIVRYQPRHAPYHTLEGNMVKNATLPGATFNRGSCTMKFKIVPQSRWTSRWAPALAAWAEGKKVIKLIGFEADEDYRLKRADARAHSGKGDPAEQRRYEYHYPLMEWGYDLGRCCQIIEDAGLPVPVKSACFFCPNQKTHEVHELSPLERSRVMLMEIVAEPYNRKVNGLWRRPRKNDGRPGSITQYILQENLPFVPLTVLGKQVVLNPKSQKARNGGEFTFAPPHNQPSLRQLMESAGHEVPQVILPDQQGGDEDTRWRERGACCCDAETVGDSSDELDTETDQHLELVAAL